MDRRRRLELPHQTAQRGAAPTELACLSGCPPFPCEGRPDIQRKPADMCHTLCEWRAAQESCCWGAKAILFCGCPTTMFNRAAAAAALVSGAPMTRRSASGTIAPAPGCACPVRPYSRRLPTVRADTVFDEDKGGIARFRSLRQDFTHGIPRCRRPHPAPPPPSRICGQRNRPWKDDGVVETDRERDCTQRATPGRAVELADRESLQDRAPMRDPAPRFRLLAKDVAPQVLAQVVAAPR